MRDVREIVRIGDPQPLLTLRCTIEIKYDYVPKTCIYCPFWSLCDKAFTPEFYQHVCEMNVEDWLRRPRLCMLEAEGE